MARKMVHLWLLVDSGKTSILKIKRLATETNEHYCGILG